MVVPRCMELTYSHQEMNDNEGMTALSLRTDSFELREIKLPTKVSKAVDKIHRKRDRDEMQKS